MCIAWCLIKDNTTGRSGKTDINTTLIEFDSQKTISSMYEEKCEQKIEFNDKSWKFIKPNEMKEVD